MGTEGNWMDDAQATSNTGLGPYKVISFEPGVEVVLEKMKSILMDRRVNQLSKI